MKRGFKFMTAALTALILPALGWATLPEPAWTWDGSGGTDTGTTLDSGEKVYTANNQLQTIESLDTKAFTFAFWGKLHNFNWQDLAGFATETAGFKLERRNNIDLLALYNCEEGGACGLNDVETSSFTLSESKLEYFVIVNNAGTFTFYKNGEAIMDGNAVLTRKTTTWTDVISGTGKKVYIGLGCSPTIAGETKRAKTSTFADVKVYEAALTAEQVKALYNDYTARAEANRIFTESDNWSATGAWKYDESQLEAPAANADAAIYVKQDSTITMNAVADLGALTIGGPAKATFVGTNSLTADSTTINTDTDVSGVTADLGTVSGTDGKILTVGPGTTIPSSVSNVTIGFSGTESNPLVYASEDSSVNSWAKFINDRAGTYTYSGYMNVVGYSNDENKNDEKGWWRVRAAQTLNIVPGANITATRLVTSDNGSAVTTINQTGGTITLAGTNTNCNDTGNNAVLLGHWPVTTIYNLEAGQLLAENGGLNLGWDGPANLTIGQETGETTALVSVKRFSGAGRDKSANVTIKQTGTLRVGAAGLDLQSMKSFTLAGGTLDLTADMTITLQHTDGLNITEDSTIRVAENATARYAGTVKGSSILTKTGTGTLNLAGATLPDTLQYAVNGGTLILPAGKEAGATVTNGNLVLQLSEAQMSIEYTADVADGVTVTFRDNTGAPITDANLVDGNTFTPALNTWTPANGNAWSEAANWSTGSLPADGDSVIIDTEDGDVAITLASDVTVANLTVKGTGTLTIAGAKLTVSNMLVANTSVTAGEDLLVAANISIADEKTVTVTNTTDLSPTSITGGAFVKNGSGALKLLGHSSPSADGTVLTIAAGSLVANGANASNEADKGTADTWFKDTTLIFGEGVTMSASNWVKATGTTTLKSDYNFTFTEKPFYSDEPTLNFIVGGTGSVTFNNVRGKNVQVLEGATYGAWNGGGVISGAGKVKIGQNLPLSGENTYTGGTVVEGVTLTIGSANALGTGQLEGSGTINLSADVAFDTLAIAESANLRITGAHALSATTTTVNGNLDVSGVTGTVGLGAVTVADGKILTINYSKETKPYTTLSAPNGSLRVANNVEITEISEFTTGAGTWIVGAGTTTKLPGGAKSDASTHIKVEGTLDVNSTYDIVFNSITLANGSVWTNTTTTYPSDIANKKQFPRIRLEGGTATISGNTFASVAGDYAAQALYLNGGTLNFAMNNGQTFHAAAMNIQHSEGNADDTAGTIKVSSGTLKFFGAKNTTDFAPKTYFVMNGGTLSLAGRDYAIGSLAGSGSVTIGDRKMLTVGALGGDTTYSGTFTGPATVTKVGSGTLTLAGNNTATQVTLNVNDGKVAITNAYQSPIVIAAEKELILGAGANVTNAVTINGSVKATGNASMSGALTGSGTITVASGTLDLTGANLSNFEGKFDIANGATLKVATDAEEGISVPEGATLQVVISDPDLIESYTTSAIAGAGTIQLVMPNGTVLSETGSYTRGLSGKGSWYEFLFETNPEGEQYGGTLPNTGTSGNALRGEAGNNYVWTFQDVGVTPARRAVRIHNKYPWTQDVPDLHSLKNWSASFFAKMPTTEGGVLMGFGTTVGDDPGFIALVRGKGENKVLLVSGGACPGNNQVTSFNILADFTVPNAEAAYHLYTFVRTTTGVEIFLDGEPWTPYNQTVTVGNGFQIGSLHGGFCSAPVDWKGFVYAGELTDYNGLTLTRGGSDTDTNGAVDMLRIYRRALTADDVKTLAAEYSYISPDGSYSRTVTEAANWVADASWTNDADQAGEKLAEPPKGAITVTADAESPVTVTMNLSEDKTFEALTLDGDGVTIAGAAGSAVAHVEGLTKVLCDATIDCGVVEMTGPVRVAEGATLTLDASDAMLEQMLDGKIIGTYKHYLTGPAEGRVVAPTGLTYEGWDVSVEQDDTDSWVLTASRANWYVIIAADGTPTVKAGNTLESASEVESIPIESLSAPIYVSAGGDGSVALPIGTTPRVEVSGTGTIQLMLSSFQDDAHATIGTLAIQDSATVVVPQNAITVNAKSIADTATIGYSAATDGWTISENLTGAYGIRIAFGSVTFSGANGGYTGTITVDEGTTLSSTGNNVTLPFGKGSIMNNGTLTVGGTNGQLPAVSGTGDVNITAQTRIAGDITATGTLTIDAAATMTYHTDDFTDPDLSINGPSIVLNNTLTTTNDGSSVTVASGKTISGTGTLTGDLTFAAGAILDATAGALTVGTVNWPETGTVTVNASDYGTVLKATSELDTTKFTAPENGILAIVAGEPNELVYTVAIEVAPEGVTLTSNALTQLANAASEAEVEKITSIVGATIGTGENEKQLSVAGLELFDNVDVAVDNSGKATVSYAFGITSITVNAQKQVVVKAKVGKLDATNGPTFADDVTVNLCYGTDVIGSAIVTEGASEVIITTTDSILEALEEGVSSETKSLTVKATNAQPAQ